MAQSYTLSSLQETQHLATKVFTVKSLKVIAKTLAVIAAKLLLKVLSLIILAMTLKCCC